jgi:hypothetical protein
MESSKRFIANKFIDLDNQANMDNELNIISSSLDKLLKLQKLEYPIESDLAIDSAGKTFTDLSIYLGTGSNAYLYWRHYLLNKNTEKAKAALEQFQQALDKSLSIYNKLKPKMLKPKISFFMGPVGLFTLQCIYAYEIKDKSLFDKALSEILNFYPKLLEFNYEMELLYGIPGYLYCLILIVNKYKDFIPEDIYTRIYELLKYIYYDGMSNCKKYETPCLLWEFPNGKAEDVEDIYLGGAHGAMGNLYMLLLGAESISIYLETIDNGFKENLYAKVRMSLDYLLSIRYLSGNFPTYIGEDNDAKLHFCHGSPSSIPLFIKAYEIYKDEKYYDCVIKSGEDLWNRGILLKGISLCHGVCGNAYFMHSIYRFTNDTVWKNRAILLACASVDKEIVERFRNHDDPGRIAKGIPDTPYSLMEGQAGQICLMCDLLRDDAEVMFPGYEI